MNAKEASAFKWRAILSNFIDDKLLDGYHHACPVCGGKDRFRFEPKTERGTYFCSHCGAGSGIHLLATLKDIDHKEAWHLVETVVETCDKELPKKQVDRQARIKNILATCVPVTETGEVSAYLHNRCIGSTPSGLLEGRARGGAAMMVGRFANGRKFTGLHVTFLRNGMKDIQCNGSPKKMFALQEHGLTGSAIRLHSLGDGTRLLLAEGIETALRAAEIFGYPAWATGSAGLLEAVQIPEQVKEILVAGDNDSSFTGQAAAYALAKRLHSDKKNVIVKIHPDIDKDWADETP